VTNVVDVRYKVARHKLTVVPPSAGADALVVRDANDTVDRVRITEDKKIIFNQVPASIRVGIHPYITFDWGFVMNLHDRILCNVIIKDGDAIKTQSSGEASYSLVSHDGSSYVVCAKLVGGYIELARAKLTGNVVMKAFDAGLSVSIDAGAAYTVPEGVYYVNLGANTVAEAYDDVADAWVEVIAAGGRGLVVSDGSNVRLRNTGTAAESSHLRRAF